MSSTRSFAAVVALSTFAVVLSSFGGTAPQVDAPASAPAPAPMSVADATRRIPMSFFENRGQMHPEARFAVTGGGLATWLTDDGMRLTAHDADRARGANVFMSFDGRSADVSLEGAKALPGKANFFRGNDSTRWVTDVPTWSAVRWNGIYRGVDVLMRDGGGQLEYDLELQPGAALDQVVLRVAGHEGLRLDGDTLVIDTAVGPIVQTMPATWQVRDDGTRESLEARFRLLDGDRFGFDVPGRDPDLALVVDPTLGFSTFVGANSCEFAYGVAVDGAGSPYLTGITRSSTFPLTAGAFDTTHSGDEGIVLKLSPGATNLLYSTFIGGSDHDRGLKIAVAANGEAVVAGYTSSPDFPMQNAFDATYGGAVDGWTARINAAGNALVYSTYLGGDDEDECHGVGVDVNGNAYVGGRTESGGSDPFPTTPGAHQTALWGSRDATVTKFDPTGNVVWSTLVGGSSNESGFAFYVDPATGRSWIGGRTSSTDLPNAAGSAQPNYADDQDAWVSELNPSGTSVVRSTYWGGADDRDYAQDIAVDAQGFVYLGGITESNDFPTTAGALQATQPSSRDSGFVVKFSPDLSTVVYATYLGGADDDDEVEAIAADAAGYAYVVGETESDDLPITSDAWDSNQESNEGFFVRLDPNGGLDYGTYIGGNNHDRALDVALRGGEVYVCGVALSGLTTSPGVYQPASAGGSGDCFLTCFNFCVGVQAESVNLGGGCVPGATDLTIDPPVLGGVSNVCLLSNFPNAHYWIFLSLPPVTSYAIPGTNCTIHVDILNFSTNLFEFAEGFTDANGDVCLPVPIPSNNAWAGVEIVLQGRLWAPGGPLNGDHASNGVKIRFGCP